MGDPDKEGPRKQWEVWSRGREAGGMYEALHEDQALVSLVLSCKKR